MQDKTFSEFMSEIYKIAEDAGSGYFQDYEKERVERRKKTPVQKREDRSLSKLSYMLNRDLPPPMYRSRSLF